MRLKQNLEDNKMSKNGGLFERIRVIFLSIILFGGYIIAYIAEGNSSGTLMGMNYNLSVTVLVILGSAAIYLMLAFVTDITGINNKPINDKIFYPIYAIALVCFIAFIIFCYYVETEACWYGEDFRMMFARERYPHGYIIAISIAVAALFFTLSKMVKTKIHGIIRKLVAVLLATFGGVLSYAPNAFKNQAWWFHHVHAYTGSIVNVMTGVPFNDTTNGIYGHYGLFFYPVVKILGDDFYAIMKVIAIFSALTFLAGFYVLDKVIKNDWLYFVSTIACLGAVANYFSEGFLFQEFPARTLFPLITLAYLVGGNKLLARWYYFLGIIIGTGAVLFNTEAGVCCLGTIAVTWILRNWSWNAKRIISKICIALLSSLGSFLLAYAIVNVYNLLCGGDAIGLKTFIYPFGSTDFDIQAIIRTQYPSAYSWHTLRSIVFCGFAFEAARRFLMKNSDDYMDNQEGLLAVGVNGMSVLLLYINHCSPAYLPPSHIQLIILLSVLAEKSIENISSPRKDISKSSMLFNTSLSLVSFILVSYFVLDCMVTIPRSIENRTESVWETESLDEQYSWLEQIVPKDMPALGYGIPEIYYQIGIDPKVYTSDWADTTPGTVAEMERVLSENDDVIMSSATVYDSKYKYLFEKYGFKEKEQVDFQWFYIIHMAKETEDIG